MINFLSFYPSETFGPGFTTRDFSRIRDICCYDLFDLNSFGLDTRWVLQFLLWMIFDLGNISQMSNSGAVLPISVLRRCPYRPSALIKELGNPVEDTVFLWFSYPEPNVSQPLSDAELRCKAGVIILLFSLRCLVILEGFVELMILNLSVVGLGLIWEGLHDLWQSEPQI